MRFGFMRIEVPRVDAKRKIHLAPIRLSRANGVRNDGLLGMQRQTMGMDIEIRHRPSGLRYGIVTAPTPWMATEKAADGQIKSLERAVLSDSLDGILRTGGHKAARRRRKW